MILILGLVPAIILRCPNRSICCKGSIERVDGAPDCTDVYGQGDVVATGNLIVPANGSFCFASHTVGEECGEFKASVDGKHDNYQVKLVVPDNEVPEFSVIGASIVLAGIGMFIVSKRKN